MSSVEQATDWQRVKGIRAKLCPHIQVHPQCYRGEKWFVLRDSANGRHLRFNAMAYEVVGRLDGERSIGQIWHHLSSSYAKQSLSQEEVIQLLAQLLAFDIIQTGMPLASETVLKRELSANRLSWRQKLMNPLAPRFSLFDPDRFLNATVAKVRPIFSKAGLITWCCVVVIAALLALVNIDKLAAAMTNDLLVAENLLLLWCLFPVIKACHEFAHAYAVKLWGGEVHDMGLCLLVLVPAPYVDASSAWAFRERNKRVLVGAAGILAELFLAALGLFVWLTVEPGIIAQAGLFTFMTGAISTLLFNANPLLRFDGYFILQDLIEIPNLASRSGRYYIYLLQRYLFGLDQVRSPVTAAGERRWFIGYGFTSYIYRLFMLVVIVLFLAEDYLIIGVALSVWVIGLQLVMPVWRGGKFLFFSDKLVKTRRRAIATTVGGLTLVTCALFFIPVPQTTLAQGVVWVPRQAQIYVETSGFVHEVLVESGAHVDAGTVLVKMRSPILERQITVVEAQRRMANIRMVVAMKDDPVKMGRISQELIAIDAELQQLYQKREALIIKSHVDGVFARPELSRLRQRHLKQGDLIGYVISPEGLIIRAVVSQADIGLVRNKSHGVKVRLAERLNRTLDAKVVRMIPAGSKQLPSLALSVEGGGEVVIDKTNNSELNAKVPMFQVDLSLPEGVEISGVGERAYIRFEHGNEALASQWWRSSRQLLLGRLSI